MKKYTETTNEFKELIIDSTNAVIEDGYGRAFNKKQVDAITQRLNKFFAKNAIIITEDEGYTITLCTNIIPIATHIKEKAKLLNQFCLNTEKNRTILCSATNVYQLERLCRDIFINW